MKLTKKLLSLVLVGAMALTTAACGGNNNNSGGGNGGGNTTGKETVLEVAVDFLENVENHISVLRI